MLGIDLATALLIAGIIVLCATTAITALALPSFGVYWRRRQRDDASATPATYGIVPPGPAARPALALPAPHRPSTPRDPNTIDDVDTAWAMIERMLEHDPDRLVEVLTTWITEDLADPSIDAPSIDAPSEGSTAP